MTLLPWYSTKYHTVKTGGTLLPPRRCSRHLTTSLALPCFSRAHLNWYVRRAIFLKRGYPHAGPRS